MQFIVTVITELMSGPKHPRIFKVYRLSIYNLFTNQTNFICFPSTDCSSIGYLPCLVIQSIQIHFVFREFPKF